MLIGVMENMSIEIHATHKRKFDCGVCRTPVFYSENAHIIFCKCRPTESNLDPHTLENVFEKV
jgi:hypothetical protein